MSVKTQTLQLKLWFERWDNKLNLLMGFLGIAYVVLYAIDVASTPPPSV